MSSILEAFLGPLGLASFLIYFPDTFWGYLFYSAFRPEQFLCSYDLIVWLTSFLRGERKSKKVHSSTSMCFVLFWLFLNKAFPGEWTVTQRHFAKTRRGHFRVAEKPRVLDVIKSGDAPRYELIEGEKTTLILLGHIFRLEEESVQIITPLRAMTANILCALALCQAQS